MVIEMCYKLNKSSMLYKRLMSKHLERLNITYSQLMVLRVINQEPGVTAKEILMQMDTDKATLSGVLSRLERDNYIIRKKNEADKRIQNIYVSGGSEKLCEDVSMIEKACINDLIDGIDMEEAERFVNVLDRFINNQLKKIDEGF
ncbi:MAG: MarR family transcriptional regulator [Bacilli bacterium]|nr:MarR family transcriptional regulator [Bacilli bacterium]